MLFGNGSVVFYHFASETVQNIVLSHVVFHFIQCSEIAMEHYSQYYFCMKCHSVTTSAPYRFHSVLTVYMK